jgi:tellurite resistance protein TerC
MHATGLACTVVPLLAATDTSNIPGGDIVVDNWLWVVFGIVIVALLLLDLLVFHREAHEVTFAEATKSSVFWIAIGLSFGLLVWFELGGDAAAQYYAGYVVEKSLSVDNVFVWAVIFGYFAVPKAYQHRVLFWGIFGALVLRAIFIFAGVALLERLDWLIFVFGGFLIFTAIRVARHDEGDIHPEKNPILRLMRRYVPITADFHGAHFTWKEAGKRFATPMLVVLVLVEATDVIFAIDSIPAILAISRSQFIVFSSNAFAILGLRALYFMLAGLKDRLVYLNQGLGVILFYVGVKMLVSRWYHIPTLLSLGIIALVLTVTVVLSLRKTANEEQLAEDATGTDEIPEETEAP